MTVASAVLWLALAQAGPVKASCEDTAIRGVPTEFRAYLDRDDLRGVADQSIPRIAVVVGVSCWPDQPIPQLPSATNDAAQVAAWLADEDFAVITLTRQVSREDFAKALERASKALQPGGILTVYHSGHGWTQAATGVPENYLLFSDTLVRGADHDREPLRRTAIRTQDLEQQVTAVRQAAKRLLIVDSCYAGAKGQGSTYAVPPVKGRRDRWLTALPGRKDLRLYASGPDEIAQVADTVGITGANMGAYTYYLLQAVRLETEGADLDRDGQVDLREAHDWAVTALADRWQTPQFAGAANVELTLDPRPDRPERAVLGRSARGRDLDIQYRTGASSGSGFGGVAPGQYEIITTGYPRHGPTREQRTVLAHTRTHLRRGRWFPIDAHVDSRERWQLLHFGIGTQPRSPAGPAHWLHGGGWYAPFDPRGLRPAVGFQAGVATPQQVELGGQEYQFSAGYLRLQAAQLWTRPLGGQGAFFSAGPALAVGPTWRRLIEGGRAEWSHLVRPSLRLQMRIDRLALTIDPGATAVRLVDGSTASYPLSPSIEVSLGGWK